MREVIFPAVGDEHVLHELVKGYKATPENGGARIADYVLELFSAVTEGSAR